MEYVIKTFDDEEIIVTRDEVQDLVGKTGLVRFPRLILDGREVRQEQFRNVASFKKIVSKETHDADQLMDRKKESRGILHDGTPVTRYFGTWYLTGDIDEKGKPLKMIDPQYYPEVAMDSVPTIEEYWKKYAHLPLEKRKRMISNKRESSLEMKRIGFEEVKKYV